jgi:hypothetical protein
MMFFANTAQPVGCDGLSGRVAPNDAAARTAGGALYAPVAYMVTRPAQNSFFVT